MEDSQIAELIRRGWTDEDIVALAGGEHTASTPEGAG